ncbi:hypothetical protein [Butyrivibrio sp. AE3004]|uniref:hypothetical protein n=1 Tax=Butyrivibrio sp. AE3004 TaxID=1506994 RepID=UPI0004941A51|nr:hypothetical protein [Butyrivibrio sp. AE3004]
MKRKISINFILCFVIVFSIMLTACKDDSESGKSDRSSIEIKKDGSVISTMVEDFNESYYSIDELREMTENEINAFVVSNGENTASLKSIDKDGEKVKLVIKFASASDYAHFNNETLVYETVSEARLSGQIDVNSLVDKDGNAIDSEKVDKLENKHVIISGSKNIISVPYKIKYVSGGISLVDKNTADFSAVADDTAVCMVLDK